MISEEPTPSHEYFLTNSDLIESLVRKLNGFINLSDKGFFLGIGDYVKFIDENSGFEEIIKAIDSFRERDRKELISLEEKLLKDITNVEKIVLKRTLEKNIKSEEVKKRLKEYEMTKDGRMQSSSAKAEALHESLSLVIMALYESGYEKLVSEFIKLVPDSKSIADYKISEYYYLYKNELREFRSKIQKTIWGSWNELVVAYLIIHKYKERMKELTDTNDVIGQMNFHGLYEEMEDILQHGQSARSITRVHFIKDDYLIHINRIHDFIINKLNSEPNKNAEEEGRGQDIHERYKKLVNDFREANEASRTELKERYQQELADIKKSSTPTPVVVQQVSTPKLGVYKLQYSPDNGFAHFSGKEHIFTGGKVRAFLSVLNGNKNTPYSIERIKEKCNPLIPDSEYYFKDRKDIDDTLLRIKKALKVNKGEFFPVQKREKNWIWIDK